MLEWLQVSSGSQVLMVHIDDVMYLESDSKYTRVLGEDCDGIIRTSLKELAPALEASFIQSHRIVLVNRRHIRSIHRTGEVMELELRGRPERLKVSLSKQLLFRSMLAGVEHSTSSAARPSVRALVGMTALVLLGLADWRFGAGTTTDGILQGMALFAVLGGAAILLTAARARPWPQAWAAALLSVTEILLGVLLIAAVAAPVMVLFPGSLSAGLSVSLGSMNVVIALLLGLAATAVTRAWAKYAGQHRRCSLPPAPAPTRQRRSASWHGLSWRCARTQIEPHFLWNTLATIQYLSRTNPGEAGDMVGLLIRFLKRAASAADAGRAAFTLAQEVESAYIGIMQIRMGPRLRTSIAIEETCKAMPFPALVLHALIENAFRHGLEPKAGPCSLVVTAVLDPNAAHAWQARSPTMALACGLILARLARG